MKLLSLVFFVFAAANSFAQSQHAHVHGEANASVVLDEGMLAIELETPAANILGFEHKPKTNEEFALIQKTSRELEQINSVVNVRGNCQLIDKNILWPFAIEKDTHAHEEDDHSDHEHDSHSDHDSHSEHDDHSDHAAAHHDEDEVHHNDIVISYQWQCEKLKKLELQFEMFNTYEGFHKVTVQWIAFNRQNSTILNRQQNSLAIEP